MQEWKCEDSVVSMVFDTTASNTGPNTTACVSNKEDLGRSEERGSAEEWESSGKGPALTT